tara:strand:- start:342 stop:614 length:273 start_codon:yes stop_codon:yes gene_type:complete
VFSCCFRFNTHYAIPFCFNLIACSSGDNSAVSVAVKPVFKTGLVAIGDITGCGCLGRGGVSISGVLVEDTFKFGTTTGISPLRSESCGLS